jgi:alpha-mannosidase
MLTLRATLRRAAPPLALAALAVGAASAPALAQSAPRSYRCYRAPGTPRLDGSLDGPSWAAAPWSAAFVDIEGDRKPAPRFHTRMKMLWDDRYLYVGAELEEPDVWGTITDRDAVIFHDNDFEMFIDPDGDALNYVELEINALNTVWDLFLAKPYRDGGHAETGWDIAGLRTGVHVLGTLNRPGDADSGWTVTMAIPWRALRRASGDTSAPESGQTWRVNFSRVEWRTSVLDGAYRKVPGLREDNWVWTPQGMIDMHQPEHWGYVTFSPLRADQRPAAAGSATAAPAPPRSGLVLSGYLADVAGAHLAYHSPDPEAETALLARARRDVQSVTWLTDTVPAGPAPDTVAFVWIAGLAGSKGLHTFDFAINGRHAASFTSIRDSTSRDWTVEGERGVRLSFRTTMVDQFRDVFGYMTLRIPRAGLVPGAPLALTVTGADAGSNDWYMTFRHRLAARPRVAQDPVLVRAGDTAEAQVHVILDNLAGYREATVAVDGHAPVREALHFGVNVMRAVAGPVASPREVRVAVRLDGAPALDTALTLAPVARRDLYLLPYSHNDIGYSDLQDRVRQKQWRNIEDALRLIDHTRDFPPEARFRWNVEILWPVESWLAHATPAERGRFFAAVRRGSIGLNAFYAGVLSGLATAPEMTHFFDYARRLRDRDSLPLSTALISDIPGQSWGIVTALAESGFHDFAIAPNSGDRIGYVLQDWGDRPFEWVSESRQDTVLTWVAGASYSLFHEARIRLIGEKRIFALMRRLDAMHYPYVPVQLPYTVDGDNGPVDPDLPDYVREWDARYATPRLVIATHAQLFRALAPYAGELPVVAGDFTGYWEDGAASSARETAMARAASSRLVGAEVLWAMIAPAGFPAAEDRAAWRDVVLWDEHTWGAAASVETPDAPDVVAQWRYKRAFATRADSLSRDLEARALASRGVAVPGAIDVFNTSSWRRTDLVLVPPALSRGGDRVAGPDGRLVPSQRLASGELAVLVRDLPAFAARRLRVLPGAAPRLGDVRVAGDTAGSPALTVVLDGRSGAVAGLTWPTRGVELVDTSHRRQLAGYLYVAGRDSSAAAGPSRAAVRAVDRGPLVATLVSDADAPGARSVVRQVRLVSGLDRVEVRVTIDKLAIRTKEGVHIAFPLEVRDGRVRWDVASSVVSADTDQLVGSARNFVEAQSWVDVSNDTLGITVATPDAPLVEIGGINAELPWMRAIPRSQTFYSYVMNNYWHTNYRADQEGPVTFRYVLRPHGAFRAGDAARLGAEARRPLLVAAAAGPAPRRLPLLAVEPEVVLVRALRPGPGGRSCVIELENPTDSPQHAELRWRRGLHVTVSASDAAGRPGAVRGGSLSLPAHGTAVLRAAW